MADVCVGRTNRWTPILWLNVAGSRMARSFLAELRHYLQPTVSRDCKLVALRLNLACRDV